MKRNKAFTLIELLVVIAIIAILAAILFPVFAQAKRAAKTSSTLSNTKQLGTALQMYASDFDDATPLNYYGTWYGDWNTFTTWVMTMYPYVKNGPIYHDTTMPIPYNATAPGNGVLNWTGYTSLASNERGLFGWYEWTGSAWVWHDGRVIASQENIADRMAFCTNRDPQDMQWGMFIVSNYWASRPVPGSLTDGAYWYNNTAYASSKNHADQIVASFADGHAKTMKSGKVFKYNGTDADWNAALAAQDDPWIKFWGSDRSGSK